MNNLEKIKQMSHREMAIFLTQIHCKECGYQDNWQDCEQIGCWCHANNDYQSYGEWLLQEVEE